MGMTVKTSFWVAVVLLVSLQVPHYQGFVTAPREEHVGVLKCRCQRSYPGVKLFISSACTEAQSVVENLTDHPEWPSRVPLITSCSAMLGRRSSIAKVVDAVALPLINS